MLDLKSTPQLIHKERIAQERVQRGFTFIELMITLVILGVVLALGVPSFREATANASLRGATMDLIAAINTARAQAVGLRNDIDVTVLGANWNSGWQIDYDNVALPQEKDQVFEPHPGVQVTETGGGLTTLTFNSRGIVSSAAVFTVCDSRAGERGRQVTVNLLGRVSSAEFICS